MIMYTVIPIEEIFDDEESPSLMAAHVMGCSVLIEPLGDGRGRIERILSTNPDDYLNSRIQPGSIVSLVR